MLVVLLAAVLQMALSNQGNDVRVQRQAELAREGLSRRLTDSEHAFLDTLEAENPEYNDYTVRLAYCDAADGSMAKESTQGGRLEFFYRDRWGTVCGKGFTNEAAQVACHSLGYKKGRAIYLHETYGPVSHLDILLADVNCTGSETHLDRCAHLHWADKEHGCTHDQDVSIVCQPHENDQGGAIMGYQARLADNYTSANGLTRYGRLEILYNDTWGTVCDHWFYNLDANVACRTINRIGNFKGCTEDRLVGPGAPGQQIWIGMMNCTGDELNVGSCPHTAWGKHTCSHADDISISCTQIISSVETPPCKNPR